MKVGLIVTGDVAVRAAHSLAAHDDIDEVVVIGPAQSRSFRVVEDAAGCDLLVGTGAGAPSRAERLGVPLVWDGDHAATGVIVFGASPQGLAIALAEREPDRRLVAVAHPGLEAGEERPARFPMPVGRVTVSETSYGGRPLAQGQSPNGFGACLAAGASRRVAIVDDGAFLSGIALAAGATLPSNGPGPVWDQALAYLQACTDMGLVMAEA